MEKNVKNIFIIVALAIFAGVFFIQQPEPLADLPKAELPSWPPVVGEFYPDLELIDQEGQHFKISDLKGRVVIIEPVGMNCPACQAFSGANDIGSFQNNGVQSGLLSFTKMVNSYSKGVRLPHPKIMVVQILLYDMKLGAPLPIHAKIWAEHFGLKKSQNEIVAVSPYDMRNSASYNLIPGFQLLDKNLVMRSDATGHRPRDDLYRKLLPMVPTLMR